MHDSDEEVDETRSFLDENIESCLAFVASTA